MGESDGASLDNVGGTLGANVLSLGDTVPMVGDSVCPVCVGESDGCDVGLTVGAMVVSLGAMVAPGIVGETDG